MNINKIAVSIFILTSFYTIKPALATDGTQLIGIGALQKGTAGAGVAKAHDSTWVLMNPASIITLGRRFDASLEFFAPDRFMDPEGPPGLANSSAGSVSDGSIFYIPTIGYTCNCGVGSLAFGIYGVNGMGVDYDSSRTLPGAAGGFDTKTEYAVAKAVVAYAYPVTDTLTFGAGLNLDYARFRGNNLTSSFTQTAGANRWDDAFGVGFQIGVQQQFDNWSWGAAYTSRQWMQEFTKYSDLFKESVDLPQTFQIGVSYNVIPEIELVADYKFLNWSGIDLMGDAPSAGGYGWDDQHSIKIGAIWDATEKLTLRTGFSYANSPIDEEVVFANALFPAITEYHVTGGFSYNATEHSDFHFTYMHAFENELTDSGAGDAFSVFGAGTRIGLSEDTFTIGYSYKF